jgi:hypothetical protein
MATILKPAVDPRSVAAPTDILHTVTLLTSQEVKALAATNIDLVPAPGAGLALVPIMVVYSLDRNAAYNDAAALGDLVLAYHTTQTALITSEADAFIDAAADAVKVERPAVTDFAPEANTAFVLDNDGAEFAGDAGNVNTLKVTVYYIVVPMT